MKEGEEEDYSRSYHSISQSITETYHSQHRPLGTGGYAEVAFCAQADILQAEIEQSTGHRHGQ